MTLRRSPEAIVQAARMDPKRSDLFVEGIHDKLILHFICDNRMKLNCRILVIDQIAEIAVSNGGAKERLLSLARIAEQANVTNLRFLVDRDLDQFLNKEYPSNTWVTDYVDMEGYLLTTDHLLKAIRLGYCSDSISIEELLSMSTQICRRITALRIISQRQNLGLSISASKKHKYITLKNKKPIFDFDKFCRGLFNNAHLSLSQFDLVMRAHEEVETELSLLSDKHVVRGKDFLDVSQAIICSLGVKTSEFSYILWSTLERTVHRDHKTLSQITRFLTEH